jgi:arylformamidase
MHTPFLQSSLHLTPEQVRMASPARLPPPSGARLFSACGGSESEEFHRQTRLIRDAWGERHVPVCEVVQNLNHFTVLEALAEPGNRLHELALQLVQG